MLFAFQALVDLALDRALGITMKQIDYWRQIIYSTHNEPTVYLMRESLVRLYASESGDNRNLNLRLKYVYVLQAAYPSNTKLLHNVYCSFSMIGNGNFAAHDVAGVVRFLLSADFSIWFRVRGKQ